MDLDPVEQRILGSLLEKQVTVPASYPLSLSGLRSACNQTSSREPMMDLDEQTVEQTARELKDRGLLRIVWSDSGRRTLKYHQTLAETLGLDGRRARPGHGPAPPRGAGTRRAAHAHRAAAPLRRPCAGRGPAGPDGRTRPAVGTPARAAPRTAGPPLGAPARAGRHRRGGTRPGRGRPGGADRRLPGRAGRPGAVDVRRRRDELCREPVRRAGRASLRALAARPGRRGRRRPADRRRRLRPRPRDGVPHRRRCGRQRSRPHAGDGRGGAATPSRSPLRRRRPAAADPARGRPRLGSGARVGTP